MKTVVQFASGGAGLAIWRRLPRWVRFPIVFGLGVAAAAELNLDVNRALLAPQIFGGKAVEGQAQMGDPTQTRRDMAAGKPVTGADALVATQVDEGAADAKSKEAKADAATESAAEIEAKAKRGERLTVVERARWLDVQIARQDVVTKQAEARAKDADAHIKEAQASAAAAQAKADIVSSKVTARMMADPTRAAADLASGAFNPR
jgi:hypothetical protein